MYLKKNIGPKPWVVLTEEFGCYPRDNRQALGRSFNRRKGAYIQRSIPHVSLRGNLSCSSVITDSLWQGPYVYNCNPGVLPLLSFISIFSDIFLSIYYVSGPLLGNVTHVTVLKVPAILIAPEGSSHFCMIHSATRPGHWLLLCIAQLLVNMAEFDPAHSFWRKT